MVMVLWHFCLSNDALLFLIYLLCRIRTRKHCLKMLLLRYLHFTAMDTKFLVRYFEIFSFGTLLRSWKVLKNTCMLTLKQLLFSWSFVWSFVTPGQLQWKTAGRVRDEWWRGDGETVILLEANSKNNEGNDSSPPSWYINWLLDALR